MVYRSASQLVPSSTVPRGVLSCILIYVIDPMMIGTIEMATNVLLHVPSIYHAKVGFEAIHNGTLGLPYIL